MSFSFVTQDVLLAMTFNGSASKIVNRKSKIETLTAFDLKYISALQPPDWDDIQIMLRFYCHSKYCHPVKLILDEKIIGIGTTILHKDTAWLAHIIVHPQYRGNGYGSAVTEALINSIDSNKYKTILLIATPLGEFVYRKLNFEIINEYVFFKDGKCEPAFAPEILPYEEKYSDALLKLDAGVSGESRTVIVKEHLAGASVYVKNEKLQGFHLPALGEGLIIAENDEAGLSLMRHKLQKTFRIALPTENKNAIEFLKQNNFTEVRRAVRMHLGEKIKWQPEKIYSRISGSMG